MSLFDQFDDEITKLIRKGCTNKEVLQKLLTEYPLLITQSAIILKRIQAVKRKLRKKPK